MPPTVVSWCPAVHGKVVPVHFLSECDLRALQRSRHFLIHCFGEENTFFCKRNCKSWNQGHWTQFISAWQKIQVQTAAWDISLRRMHRETTFLISANSSLNWWKERPIFNSTSWQKNEPRYIFTGSIYLIVAAHGFVVNGLIRFKKIPGMTWWARLAWLYLNNRIMGQ